MFRFLFVGDKCAEGARSGCLGIVACLAFAYWFPCCVYLEDKIICVILHSLKG